MSYVHPVFIFIELEIGIIFVYGVVCEVHAQVGEVISGGRLVFFCCESAESFVEYVDSEWVTTGK